MKYFFVFCLILSSYLGFAQNRISATEFNLGEINQLNEEILDLNITNNTGQKVYLLRIEHSSNFEVKYTSKSFEKNAAQIVRLKYRPKKKGRFSEEIKLYFSSNNAPINITVSGEIQIVPKNLLQACPDFSNKQVNPLQSSISNPQNKAEIKKEFVNLMPNNTLESEEVIDADDEQISDNVESEIIEPIKIIQKEIKTVTIVEEKAEDVPIIAPISTQPNELSRNDFIPNNIIFLIDASMSMGKNDKLSLLKSSIHELLNPLREIDKIAIVNYKDEAEIILPSTPANNKQFIKTKLETISAGGVTSGNKGLIKAYEVAYDSFIEGGNNQIYLVTDGAFKIGEKNERVPKMIQDGREKGIYITSIGIKNERWTEKNLKSIAKDGNGEYISLNDESQLNVLLNQLKKQSLKGN